MVNSLSFSKEFENITSEGGGGGYLRKAKDCFGLVFKLRILD